MYVCMRNSRCTLYVFVHVFFVIENSRKAFLVVVIVFMLRILIRVLTYVYVDKCQLCLLQEES